MRDAPDYFAKPIADDTSYIEGDDQQEKRYKQVGQHQHQMLSPVLQLSQQ
jgi:hypothetical protein